MSTLTIRKSAPPDVALILSFIHKKADFDRALGGFSGQLQATEAKIQRALFSEIPFAYVLLAELDAEPVGFALYGFHFSSFAGQPNLWLDDLYVEPAARNQGVGSALMARLAEIARANDCTHLGWNADARNAEGLRFYQQLGAEIITLPENRRFLRWPG